MIRTGTPLQMRERAQTSPEGPPPTYGKGRLTKKIFVENQKTPERTIRTGGIAEDIDYKVDSTRRGSRIYTHGLEA